MTEVTTAVISAKMENIEKNLEDMDRRNSIEHRELKNMIKEAMDKKADVSEVNNAKEDIKNLQNIIKWLAYIVIGAVVTAIMSLILNT